MFEIRERTNERRSIQVDMRTPSSVFLTSEHMFATAINSPGEGGVLVKAAWRGVGNRAVVVDSVEHFVAPMDVKVFDRQELQNRGKRTCTLSCSAIFVVPVELCILSMLV